MRRLATGVAVLLSLPALAADLVHGEAAGLRFSVPRAWTRVPASSDVRAAQWRLGRAPGDPEDGEIILFFAGAGKGGGTQENVDRWITQFAQPDGRPSRETAVVTKRSVNGLEVTAVDLAGTYRAGPSSDGPLPPPKRGFRILAAAVDGDGGPWFFTAIGPDRTIAAAKPGFDAMLDSLATLH